MRDKVKEKVRFKIKVIVKLVEIVETSQITKGTRRSIQMRLIWF